jgi:8-hydroxy-5-deazaflavin:NADPH oxidoreductase
VDIAVIGTGFIGSTLGRALSRAGHQVTLGSRHPDDAVVSETTATVGTVGDAVTGSDVIILALPAGAVDDLTAHHGGALSGKLVIDATNRMGEGVANSRAALPPDVRYARAFNTLGGENMADPVFPDGRADLFFSAPLGDRTTVETIVEGVGLRPVYVGEDQEVIVDSLFRLWIELAITQGRGRRLAFRLLEG